MGIKPSGSSPVVVPPDNVQSRWGAWEASIDVAGQQAGEVFAETHAIAESANTIATSNSVQVQNLLADSAGLGDESKTIQQQMRELLDPNNPDSELWILQGEVDRLQDERNDLQDKLIEMNRQDIDRNAEYVSRFLFVPGFNGASDDYFSVTYSGRRWRVEAKSAGPAAGWVGMYTLQSAYMNNGNFEPVIDYRTVPSGDPASPRVQYHNGAEYSTIINYWVRNAIHKVDDKVSGAYTTADTAWTTRSELTFTAPIAANYSLYYRVKWDGATYDDTYSFRIQRNGVTILQWGPMTHVGPQFPWNSGVRTRTIQELSVPLSAGDVLTFQTYSNADLASQRSVLESERKISWLMPATQENMEA